MIANCLFGNLNRTAVIYGINNRLTDMFYDYLHKNN